MEQTIETIQQLKNWFKDNAKEIYEQFNSGAQDQDLKKLREETNFQQLQPTLQIFLQQVNGSFQLHDQYKTLSIEEIIEINEVNAVSGYWKNNYLTFAQDNDENYLVIENDTGKVINWNNDEGIQEPVSDDIKLYLEKLLQQVQSKELVYEEEFGLIENTN